jgi:hypothetical protein
MTYTILCDGYILHDSRNPTLRLVQPKLNLELNKNGTLTFTIYDSHPYYDNISKLKSIITVYQGTTIVFKGRVIDDTTELYKSKKVTVEGVRAYLLDSIYRPFSYQGDVTPFLQSILDSHNSQVETFQQFTLGTVTVTDPNGYINRSSIDYLTSYEVIKTRLIDTLGGYLVVRYESDGNYIDYLSDFTDTSTQNIEFAVNLSDLSQKVDGTSIYTGIIPLGSKLKDSSGNTTDERLTIESVNDNKDYLIDDTSAAIYGKIFEVVTWDDVTIASNLLTKAQAYLAANVSFLVTLDLSAVDLNATSEDIENFKVGEYIRIKSSPHGIDNSYLLKKIALDIENPANTKIQLGESYKSLTDISVGQSNSSNDLATRIETVETHYIPNTQMTAVINETIEDNSLIQQMPDNILLQVSENYTATSDFTDFQEDVTTQFTQTATDFTLQFETLLSQINTLDDDTQQQFSDIIKYIRFVDGDIILGQVDNPFILKITSTKISFLENNLEVAYMSNGKLYIKDGEFLNSMQLGNFTFFPRGNGNLSFYKTH